MKGDARFGVVALAFAASLAAALVPRSALAACNDLDRASETAAFRQGLQRYRDGDAAGAVEIWQGLIKTLGPTCGYKVLFNLGRAYEKLGDPTRAIESYAAFVDAAGKQELDVKEAGSKKEAEQSITALKAKYGAIRVAAPQTGMVLVRVGTGDPQPAGFTVYVVPGTHQVELFARTTSASTKSVTVRAGEVTEVPLPEATPTRAAPAPPADRPRAPANTAPTESGAFPTVPVVIGSGLTVAAGAATIVFWARQDSKRDEAEKLERTDPEYARLWDDHSDARTVYHASLVVTGVLATATAAVVVIHLISRKDDAPIRAQAAASPGGANLSVTARF